MRYLLAILALGSLIAVHELGHLLLARLFGVRVNRYAIGFGPVLLALRFGATEYSLRAIPVGGYVQLHGMNPFEEGVVRGDPASYTSLAPWKRLLILGAGPFTNLLLAVGLLCTLYMTGTHVPVPMTIGTVEPGSEAARAQLRPGDVLLSMDGAPVATWSAFVVHVAERPGRVVSLGVLRHGDVVDIQVRPRQDERGVGRIGVRQQYVFRQHGLGEALRNSLVHTKRLVVEGSALVWRMVRGQPGVELSSPVAVAKQVSDAAGGSLDSFLRMLVALSIALAVFNLLPFPALDGGRMLFVSIESTTGCAVPAAVEALLHLVGFFSLIALTLWVAFLDVQKMLGRNPFAPTMTEDGGTPMVAFLAPDGGAPVVTPPASDGGPPAVAPPASDGGPPAVAAPAPDGGTPAVAAPVPDGGTPAVAAPVPDGGPPAAPPPSPDGGHRDAGG